MNAQTRMSEKGQVVIPRDVRRALELAPGQQFDVLQAGSDVILRPTGRQPRLSFEEAVAALRRRVRYDGPAISVGELSWSRRIGEDDAVA
ncbi:AbrB/MazE/SpoVT family DNA-binding domain-containing protein [uncultured Sphingomonas sp.]|uniref:AbrB/MazE/SpoVT family DNA-binding domain-containing protein n=1 Tax=uncultured Sphingomonas sp. TaxID=158754 RepID=UPI0035C98531